MTVLPQQDEKEEQSVNCIVAGCSYSCIYAFTASVTPQYLQGSHTDVQCPGAMNMSRNSVVTPFLIPFYCEVQERDMDIEAQRPPDQTFRSEAFRSETGVFFLSSQY